MAVVNDEVITLHELCAGSDRGRQPVAAARHCSPRDVPERQMLERLIMDKVQLQHARDRACIDDVQLDQALQRIAANNKHEHEEFREALKPMARFTPSSRGYPQRN